MPMHCESFTSELSAMLTFETAITKGLIGQQKRLLICYICRRLFPVVSKAQKHAPGHTASHRGLKCCRRLPCSPWWWRSGSARFCSARIRPGRGWAHAACAPCMWHVSLGRTQSAGTAFSARAKSCRGQNWAPPQRGQLFATVHGQFPRKWYVGLPWRKWGTGQRWPFAACWTGLASRRGCT